MVGIVPPACLVSTVVRLTKTRHGAVRALWGFTNQKCFPRVACPAVRHTTRFFRSKTTSPVLFSVLDSLCCRSFHGTGLTPDTHCFVYCFFDTHCFVYCFFVAGPGLFQNVAGQAQCQACEMGRFSRVLRASSCEQCKPGTGTVMNASAFCNDCPRGRFGALGEPCVDCDAQTFTKDSGSDLCAECPAGYVAFDGA